MIGIILLIAVFGILILLFIPLVRLAKRKGAPPRLWESALLCAWALIWLTVSYIRRTLEAYLTYAMNERYFILAFGFILSLAAYGIIWWLLSRKADYNNYEHKINQIGKSEDHID